MEQNYGFAQQFLQDIKQNVKDVDCENYAEVVKDELLKKVQTNYKSANDYINDEEFLNNYVYQNQTIRDNIIRDYLANLTNTKPVKVVSNISSSIPIAPPNVPNTIQEAGKLAKNIIKQI